MNPKAVAYIYYEVDGVLYVGQREVEVLAFEVFDDYDPADDWKNEGDDEDS